MADLLWTAIKPNVDADLESRLAGSSGGRGKKKGACGADESTLANEEEPPLNNSEKEGLENSKEGFSDSERGVLNPPKGGFSDSEKGAFGKSESDVDDDDDVDEDVEGDDDDDARADCFPDASSADAATADVGEVSSWLDAHGLGMGKKETSLITASLAGKLRGLEFLDYSLDFLTKKSFRARDGTGGNVSFDSIPEGNRRGLFLSAVTQWNDLDSGFEDWKRRRNKPSADRPRTFPSSCPKCGGEIREEGGEALCSHCKAYLNWSGKAWELEPYTDIDLSWKRIAGEKNSAGAAVV
ncbi:MAG: hypothetical protein IJR93_03040 [Treponema sp.]|nr:hypothetical protein [Treponema sp.]